MYFENRSLESEPALIRLFKIGVPRFPARCQMPSYAFLGDKLAASQNADCLFRHSTEEKEVFEQQQTDQLQLWSDYPPGRRLNGRKTLCKSVGTCLLHQLHLQDGPFPDQTADPIPSAPGHHRLYPADVPNLAASAPKPPH